MRLPSPLFSHMVLTPRLPAPAGTPAPARAPPTPLTFIVLSFASLHRRRPGRTSGQNPKERETKVIYQNRSRAAARSGANGIGGHTRLCQGPRPQTPFPRPQTLPPRPKPPTPRPRPGPLPGGPRWWPTCFMNSRRGAGRERPPPRPPARPGLSPALSRPRARRPLPGRRPGGRGGG